jgi:signal transduction histidine kinase
LQLDHAQMSPVFGEVDLHPFVQEAVHGSLEPERIKIASNKPVVMYTDSQLLAVVLHNLFDNALKYSPKGSEVTVSLQAHPSPEQSEALVEIVVRNALSPMSKPDARNIFDKYYRGVGSLGVSGSGLGLYLVRQLTGLLGGTIACKTQDEHIAFILRLPMGAPDKRKL